MTKPTKWCAPSEDSDQSNQSSPCAQWVAKDPWFLHADSEDSDKTGRMPSRSDQTGQMPSWSESLLGAHSFCWFCHVATQILNMNKIQSKVDEKAMIRNRCNWIPYSSPGTTRERNTNNQECLRKYSIGGKPRGQLFRRGCPPCYPKQIKQLVKH